MCVYKPFDILDRRVRSSVKNLNASARICLLSTTLLSCIAFAQPFVPSNDDTVVEVLPRAIVALAADIRASSMLSLRRHSEQELLQQLMESYRVALAEQDPRAYGRTLALLQQWPGNVRTGAMYHVLYAAVLQHNHAFDVALSHLDEALELEPGNGQALMIRAQIGLVTGDYALTQDSCVRLRTAVRFPVFLNCQAQLDGVTGKGEQTLVLLQGTLNNSKLSLQDFLELKITAATIAHRLGRTEEADRYYRAALLLDPLNSYALVHYGDLLLQSNRSAALVNLLSTIPPGRVSTELKILLAEALGAKGSQADELRSAAIVDELQAEFSAAYLRRDAFPHKEFARFSLSLSLQPEQALEAAEENWQLQKEPSDTLLLARAAAATNSVDVLDRLRDWIRLSGTEDVQLSTLLSAADGQLR